MAIAPGTYDMTIQRRSDHSVSVTLKDSSNAAVNLGGYTIASQVWNTDRTTKAADATCTVTSAVGGAFDWKLTDTQTAKWDGSKWVVEEDPAKVKYKANEWKRNRRFEYPSINDVVVALAEKEEGDDTMWKEITALRQKVKSDIPKPT